MALRLRVIIADAFCFFAIIFTPLHMSAYFERLPRLRR